jgi:hypothetical protein
MGCPFTSLMNPAIGAPMAAARTAALKSLLVFIGKLLRLPNAIVVACDGSVGCWASVNDTMGIGCWLLRACALRAAAAKLLCGDAGQDEDHGKAERVDLIAAVLACSSATPMSLAVWNSPD